MYNDDAAQLSSATLSMTQVADARRHTAHCAHQWTRNIFCPLCHRSHQPHAPLCSCTCERTVADCISELTQLHDARAWDDVMLYAQRYVHRVSSTVLVAEQRLRTLPATLVHEVSVKVCSSHSKQMIEMLESNLAQEIGRRAREQCGTLASVSGNGRQFQPSAIDLIATEARDRPIANLWLALRHDLLTLSTDLNGYWSTWRPCLPPATSARRCWNGHKVVVADAARCAHPASSNIERTEIVDMLQLAKEVSE